MGVVVTLRDNKQKNLFKKFLFAFLETNEAEEVIISSGYFQDGYYNNSLYKKLKLAKPAYVDLYRVTEDEKSTNGNTLLTAIGNKCESIILVGVNEYKTPIPSIIPQKPFATYEWFTAYGNFICRMCGAYNNRVHAYYSKSGNWHAKVFMISKKDSSGIMTPIAGIVGSSNLTRRAFSNTYDFFNIEADTILYDTRNRNVTDTVHAIVDDCQDNGVIITASDETSIRTMNAYHYNNEMNTLSRLRNRLMLELDGLDFKKLV